MQVNLPIAEGTAASSLAISDKIDLSLAKNCWSVHHTPLGQFDEE
jgi:hypothetical protein